MTVKSVGLESLEPFARERAVDGLAQQSVELAALHSVMSLACHHITCL
jgi:hypothetical protein